MLKERPCTQVERTITAVLFCDAMSLHEEDIKASAHKL